MSPERKEPDMGEVIKFMQETYGITSADALKTILRFADSVRSAPIYDLTDKSRH